LKKTKINKAIRLIVVITLTTMLTAQSKLNPPENAKIIEDGKNTFVLIKDEIGSIKYNITPYENKNNFDDSIPTFRIYESQLDTNDYKDVFRLWHNVPVGKEDQDRNGGKYISDVNNNGKPNIVGRYYTEKNKYDHAIFEYDKEKDEFIHIHSFLEHGQRGYLGTGDFDSDGYTEVLMKGSYCYFGHHTSVINYEQTTPGGIPSEARFDHHDLMDLGDGIIEDFNQNGYPEFVCTYDSRIMIKFLEYDPEIKTFKQIISYTPPYIPIGQHVVPIRSFNIDNDAYPDLVMGEMGGRLLVCEVDSRNQLTLNSAQMFDTYNLYGIDEFIDKNEVKIAALGLTNISPDFSSFALRTFICKIEGYELIPVQKIEIITSSFPWYGFTQKVHDVDGDGIDEIMILNDNSIFILKKMENGEFEVLYYSRIVHRQDGFLVDIFNADLYDFDEDGKAELIVYFSTRGITDYRLFSAHILKLNK